MPGKERLPSSAQTAGGWREVGSPQTGSPAAWPPSCSCPCPPLTSLKVMMGDRKGLGKAAPLKWMELQRNSFYLNLSHPTLSPPLFFFFKLHLITHSENTATKLSLDKNSSPSLTLLPPPFRISVAGISKQGKLCIARVSPPIQTPEILYIGRIRQHRG